jgi:hypothetical protein
MYLDIYATIFGNASVFVLISELLFGFQFSHTCILELARVHV